MTEHEFWTMIEEAHREAHGQVDGQADLLVAGLAAKPIEEVVSFAQWFNHMMDRAHTNALLAAHYLIQDGSHSGDGFEYFRGWLIGQGQTVFKAAVADPESLAGQFRDGASGGLGDSVEPIDPVSWTDGELLTYVAMQAARAKLGEAAVEQDMALYDAIISSPPGLPANTDETTANDPPIEDADAPKRLPRLAARLEALWGRDAERPRNLVPSPQPDGSTVFYYPTTLRVAFALGPDGRPIRGVGDVL